MPKQNPKLLTEFGRGLAALRTQAGTQIELAQELGISQRMISCYEGHTEYSPVALLPSLAELLGVTADELLSIAPLKKARQPDSRPLRRMEQIEKLDTGKKRQVLQMIDTLIENEQLKRYTARGGTAHANG
ncbi:MAG: helix-turn-helix transcriptional regulator [Porticoccaceae bacterium]